MALTPVEEVGFALAALLANDRTLAAVEAALAPASAARIRAQLSTDEPKARKLARLLEHVRPPLLTLTGLSPRLIALLAPRLPRTLAREYTGLAGTARKGFSPPPELSAVLLRIARSLSPRVPP